MYIKGIKNKIEVSFDIFRKKICPSDTTLTLALNHLLVLYAFLLPISGRAVSSIFVCILILVIIRGKFKYYAQDIFKNKIVQACIFFFFINILWLFGTDNIDKGKDIIGDMKYLLYPIVFLLFLDKSFSKRVFFSFIYGMLFSEFLSYLIHFNLLPHILSCYDVTVYEIQSLGNPTPFINHGKYNIFLSIVVSVLLYMVLSKNTKNSLIPIIFIVTASINLSLIGGRIGYIGFILTVLLAVFLAFKKESFKYIISALIIISSFFYIAYHSSLMFQQRVDTTLNSLQKLNQENKDLTTSTGVRVALWMYSSEVIKNNYLFGVGTGDHVDEVRNEIKSDGRDLFLLKYNNLHSGYLEILVQFGLLGFLVYLNIFYQIIRYKYKDEIDRSIMLIVSLGISIGIITGVYGSGLYLALFALTIATIATEKSEVNTLRKITFKTYVYYMLWIIFFFLVAILQ